LRLLSILCSLQLHTHTHTHTRFLYIFQISLSICVSTTGISEKYVTCKYLPRRDNYPLVQILATCPFAADCR
jgi:hypothetical protein